MEKGGNAPGMGARNSSSARLRSRPYAGPGRAGAPRSCLSAQAGSPRYVTGRMPVLRFVLGTLVQTIEALVETGCRRVRELPGLGIVQQRGQRVPLDQVGRRFDDVIASGLTLDV